MKLADYFLPYQKRWILDDSAMKLYAKSRRIGITYATSFRVNDKCLRRPGTVQWVTSRDEFTAHEFITEYVAKWAAASNAVCRGLAGENASVIDPLHGIRAYTAEYGNGSRVISLSSTPEAFAGKGGDILIDEADLHQDSGKVIDMALPCTTWGGQLEMVSALSVDGSAESPFCRMLREAEHGANAMGWSVHRTSILDAVEEGFVERVNEMTGKALGREEWLKRMRAKCRTEDAWRTQYLIEAAAAGGALLDYGMIGGCENDAGELEKALAEHPKALRFAGYDVGRTTPNAYWTDKASGGFRLTSGIEYASSSNDLLTGNTIAPSGKTYKFTLRLLESLTFTESTELSFIIKDTSGTELAKITALSSGALGSDIDANGVGEKTFTASTPVDMVYLYFNNTKLSDQKIHFALSLTEVTT